MATYTYKCSDCGAFFDVEATMQEKEEGAGKKFMCLKCRSTNIKQKFSVTNFIKNIFSGDEEKGGCCPNKKDGGSCCG